MLRQRVNTNDNVWTPAFKKFRTKTDTALMKELSCLWSDVIDQPVEVLHPVLPIREDPVVKTDQTRRKMVRLLNRPYHTNCIRFAFQKLLNTSNDGCRCGPVSATGIRRDDQNFRNALRH